MGRRSKMDIIITMAGLGSRFKSIGFHCPKHEIIARDQSLFEWSMLSLTDLFDHRFIFVTRKGYYDYEFIRRKCFSLGIKLFDIVEVDHLTSGQAETAFKANSLIAPFSPVAIFNIDTYIEQNSMDLSMMNQFSGFIPVFDAEGTKWSFISLDENKEIIDVVEKKRVSSLATVGFYYFESWSLFKSYYNKYHKKIIDIYNESYIAPLYKYMIDDGLRLGYTTISSESVHVLGTPEDVIAFDSEYKSKNL